ncbi:PAS domain S-box protein [Pedobacter heparinus]|uniref:PAS domain S-box protein n=1 Tax=Pedobacter heparinus TaxID=984 RepID=UPI002931210B|nr:PAS domain S-box protein [Pedobacter heparinus]
MTNSSHKPPLNKQPVAASEDRFRALISATSDIVYSMSADWRVMQELDGRGFLSDTKQPMADWLPKYVPSQDLEKVKTAIDEAIQEKKIFQLEHRVLQADGSPGWTFSRAVPIFNDKGELIEWFGAASDITERKRTEEALREERERSEQQKRLYETITAGTPDLIYVFDLNYRFTYANSALLSMWGKTWDDAIGRNLLENGYEPWHAEMHEREIDHIKATKQAVRGEVAFPHATLGRRIYDYILTPVVNDKGEVEAVAGTTRDVTERKEWELTLARSSEELQTINEEMAAINEEMATTNEEMAATNEELTATNEELAVLNEQLLAAQQKIEEAQMALRLAINAANFGTWFIQSETREFVADARLKEFFGFHPDDEILYDDAINQIHQDYRQQAAELMEATFSKGTRFDMEYPIIGHHDGKTRWVRGIGEIQRSDGKDFFAGVLHEITEKKEDELRKNDFIAMVSHELKTPLTSVKGYTQMLHSKMKRGGDDFAASVLEKANTQVAKMTSMINGFLNVSRLESGKIHIDLQLIDLAELIKEAEEESLATISSHQVVFEPVETTMVNADRDKIEQVIHNLISNAVKYSPGGSIINVACTIVNGMANISIKDQGMGIKPDDLPKIFDRFYRVEGSHMYSISGFGIGLYLCSEIIDRHHGKIWAESELGRGSTFSFGLPLSGQLQNWIADDVCQD